MCLRDILVNAENENFCRFLVTSVFTVEKTPSCDSHGTAYFQSAYSHIVEKNPSRANALAEIFVCS